MNKKDEIKIDVLSQIDDDIIEKQTRKRFALMTGKPKKNHVKMISILSSAAAFVLVCGILLGMLWPMLFDGRQVPVYEGMTVSNTAPTVKLDIDRETIPKQLSLVDGFYGAVLKREMAGPDDNRFADAPELVKDDRSLYYAKKNEDIYVTVHLNNPENFEILSFTLNGFKYQSYMFEDGSDSEQLILKINVGDVEGMVDYTIDAIKYVDGTEIKDVRMDGDRTVRVAVYPEDQPTAAWSGFTYTETQVRFELLVTDPNSLIRDSEGEVYAALYEGETQRAKQTVTVGEKKEIVFSDLTPGVEYRCEVVADYDSLDGRGYGSYLLDSKTFYTKSYVEILDFTISDNTVTFDLFVVSDKNVVIQTVELKDKHGTLVQVGDAATRSFQNVYPGEYRLEIQYTYDLGNGPMIGFAEPKGGILLDYLTRFDQIVKGGVVRQEYSKDLQIWNETTQDYRNHYGVDIYPTTSDMGVYAAMSGVVSFMDNPSGARDIVVTSEDGSCSIIYRSVTDILVEAGQTIYGGQKIASVGKTHYEESLLDPHLHLEIEFGSGNTVDPREHFR